jgi:hypothetical protein
MWNNDEVVVELPKVLYVSQIPDTPEMYAFMDGTIVYGYRAYAHWHHRRHVYDANPGQRAGVGKLASGLSCPSSVSMVAFQAAVSDSGRNLYRLLPDLCRQKMTMR